MIEAAQIVLVNQGSAKLFASARAELKTDIISSSPTGWLNIEKAISPIESPDPGSLKRQLALEAEAMKTNEIDPDILDFVVVIKNYYEQVAVSEGFIPKGGKIDFRVIFVPTKIYKKYDEKGNIGGFVSNSTNTIYYAYPEAMTDEWKFQTMKDLFHEGRHRIGRTTIFVDASSAGSENVDSYHVVNGSRGLGVMNDQRCDTDTLEEIFTVGWEFEHINDIKHEKFQQLMRARSKGILESGGQIKYVTRMLTDGNIDAYSEYLDMYEILKKRIPDFMDLCIRVRAGEPNTKSDLAQKIIKQFGREGLAGLVYCDEETKKATLSLIYVMAMDKLGRAADLKQTNEYWKDKYLNQILMHIDKTGGLAKRFSSVNKSASKSI